MEKHEIQSLLMDTVPLQEIYVSGENGNFQIIIISKIFDNMSQVKRQQTIYTPLMKYITNNHIHALSIKAYSPQEWKHNHKFNFF